MTEDIIFRKFYKTINISALILNFVQIMMSFVTLKSKSLRFYGFHSDYRIIFCFLIPFQIILTCIGTTNYVLIMVNNSWMEYWLDDDYFRYYLYQGFVNFFAILSMMSQLSCLIFGYFRYR